MVVHYFLLKINSPSDSHLGMCSKAKELLLWFPVHAGRMSTWWWDDHSHGWPYPLHRCMLWSYDSSDDMNETDCNKGTALCSASGNVHTTTVSGQWWPPVVVATCWLSLSHLLPSLVSLVLSVLLFPVLPLTKNSFDQSANLFDTLLQGKRWVVRGLNRESLAKPSVRTRTTTPDQKSK